MRRKIISKFPILIWVMGMAFAPAVFAGGGHGGENSLNGKPIEDYVWTPEEILKSPEYQQTVAPVIQELAVAAPDFAMKLKSEIRQKTWFQVPESLDVLPSSVTGLAFKTSQDALHGAHEVFIDSQSYAQKSVADRGVVLLHELLMATRIDSRTTQNDLPEIEASVRALTVKLKSHPRPNEIQQLLFDRGFGTYASKYDETSAKVDRIATLKELRDRCSTMNLDDPAEVWQKDDPIVVAVITDYLRRATSGRFKRIAYKKAGDFLPSSDRWLRVTPLLDDLIRENPDEFDWNQMKLGCPSYGPGGFQGFDSMCAGNAEDRIPQVFEHLMGTLPGQTWDTTSQYASQICKDLLPDSTESPRVANESNKESCSPGAVYETEIHQCAFPGSIIPPHSTHSTSQK